MRDPEPDSIDWKTLATLQENARIPNVELAEKVHLSASTCLARVSDVRPHTQSGL
jgi:DNA-binding Lrp family transcriptional regulator